MNNKRNVWKYDETKELLQIMQDNNYAHSFSNKHKQNVEIFRKIEKAMIQSGYHYKSYMQIGVRWKNLKNLYMKAKRSNSKSEQQLFPFYDEMDRLLNGSSDRVASEEHLTTPDPTDEPDRNETLVDESDSVQSTGFDQIKQRGSTDLRQTRNKGRFVAPKSFPTPLTRRTGQGRSDRTNRFEALVAMSKRELSEEFFRSQKRLIDYEFDLYARKEEEFIERIQTTTRTMLEESMDNFFTQLKDVMRCRTVEHVEVIGTYE
uniref:Myb/SANT-like DNA-binding domain-containing protein n=1 Tax=Anopheles farauti TaxID=69004 RepID=A0A182QQG6_9DIPT